MSGMSDPINTKLVEALEAMCEIYVPDDDSKDNDAVAGYAMNILETVKQAQEAYKAKPLPEEDVWQLAQDINPHDPMYPIHFARAVERKHGIGAE